MHWEYCGVLTTGPTGKRLFKKTEHLPLGVFSLSFPLPPCVPILSPPPPSPHSLPPSPLLSSYLWSCNCRANNGLSPCVGKSLPCTSHSECRQCCRCSGGSAIHFLSACEAPDQRCIAWTSHCNHRLGIRGGKKKRHRQQKTSQGNPPRCFIIIINKNNARGTTY